MATEYNYELHIIATAAESQKVSAAMEKACPDVGPNNLNVALNANGDDKTATHFEFSAPITDRHRVAFEPLLNGVGVKWWLTDRSEPNGRGGKLLKTFDNAKPEAVKFDAKDALAALDLKRQVVPINLTDKQ